MIITYSREDLISNAHFLGEQLVDLTMLRTPPFHWDAVKQQIKNIDGEEDKFVYRNFVPFQRIWLAIHDWVNDTQPTREVFHASLAHNLDALKIQTNQFLTKYASDMTARRSLDLWVDFAVNCICNWPNIIFYGPGTGDDAGATLDQPSGGNQSAKQKRRVEAGALYLQRMFNTYGIKGAPS